MRAVGFAVEGLSNAVFHCVYGAFVSARHDDRARVGEAVAEH